MSEDISEERNILLDAAIIGIENSAKAEGIPSSLMALRLAKIFTIVERDERVELATEIEELSA